MADIQAELRSINEEVRATMAVVQQSLLQMTAAVVADPALAAELARSEGQEDVEHHDAPQ